LLRRALICLLLAVSTAWVYADALRFDFVSYDDPGYVVDNPYVARGLSREGWSYALHSTHMGLWHPLTWLSLMLDYELYGLRAGGYHATNLLLHVLNTLLLFLLLRAMTRSDWKSALVAALFALHPLHVESVVWVSERKDVLSSFFGLLAMAAYAAYARRPSLIRYAGVALPFALALLAKPMLVTLPLLLLLLDYWPLARFRGGWARARWLLLEKGPLLMLSLACGLATLWVHRGTEATDYAIVGRKVAGVSGVNLANALVSYVRYLGKALWASELSVFYPHPALTEAGGVPLEAWQVAGAAALLASISFAVIRWRRPYASFGWWWYLVSLLPVIGIVQTGAQAMADRYTYLPLIGIFSAVVWGGAELVARWRPAGRSLAPVAWAAALLALVGYGVAAQRALQPWRSSIPLYENALRVDPRNNLMRINYGTALVERGEVDKGLAQFRRALEVNPRDVDALYNLARTLASRRRYDEAIAQYEALLRIRPDHAIAHNNLAIALIARGREDEAIDHFLSAIELGLERRQIHYDLANLLLKRGDLPRALQHYRRTLEIDPNHAGAKRALQALQGRTP